MRARHAWIVDWAIAVGFTAAVVLITHKIEGSDDSARALNWLGYTCIVFAGLPLGFRRRAPLTVLAVTTVAIVRLHGLPLPRRTGLPRARSSRCTRSAPSIPAASGASTSDSPAGCISSAGIINDTGDRAPGGSTSSTSRGASRPGSSATRPAPAGTTCSAWRNGPSTWRRPARRRSRRLVAEERLRIARDLHDVVAHSLASINIQAGAGAHVAAAHPEQAAAALVAIKNASKEALDELRLTLGVLRVGRRGRATRAGAVAGPARRPGRADRAGGAAGRGRRDRLGRAAGGGRRRRVPDRAGVVDQRACATPGPRPARRCGWTTATDALEIDVVDDGLGSTALNDSPGHGIAGMRERAAGLGGTLSATAVVRRRVPRAGRAPDPGRGVVVIRVVLADDQALVRAGFRMLLDAEPDIEVVGEASDGVEALDIIRQARPDVVLMDIRMPELDGLEATRLISQSSDLDAVRVLILTTFEMDEYVFEALRSGASGFLVKDTEPEDLLRAVRVVAAGEALLSPSVTRTLIGEFVVPARAAIGRARLPGAADRPGTGGARRGRDRAEQRRDRGRAGHLARHRAHPREPHHDEARRARSRPARRARVPVRPGRPRPYVGRRSRKCRPARMARRRGSRTLVA